MNRQPSNTFRRGTCCLIIASLILLTTCTGTKTDVQPAKEIVVAAAANLSDSFEEMGKRFTARTGVRVTNSFGATAQLSTQIENGAPFDVFAAADVKHVDDLAAKNLLTDGSRAVFARGSLVLWTPRGGAAEIKQIADLTGARVSKISVANPELAPYGQAAVESLRALNLWTQVESKVVYAPNVAQAKQFAASGNAEAAFIPRSLVKAGEGTFIEVDESLHQPLDHAIGIVRSSKQQDDARRFVDFVLSEEGQAVLESYGYRKSAGAR